MKMIGRVSLIGKIEEKICMCGYVRACTNTTVCLCAPEKETGEVRGCAVVVSALYPV